MNRKAFIIIVEKSILENGQMKKLIDALKIDKDVKAWWHHISNTVIIITNSNVTATSIQKYVKNYFTSSDFIVLRIERAKEFDGWLNENAWNWINNSLNKI